MLRTFVSLPGRALRLLTDSLRWDRPFARNVFVVALPMVIQQLLTASLHIVDGLMVSGLGDAAYSAVTQANRVTFMFNLFSFGTCTGGAIFLSQYWGARDIRRMRQAMGLTMMFVLIVAAVFMSASLLMPRQLIALFLPQGESFDRAVEYLSIVAVVAVAGFGAAVRMVTSATDGEQAISQRSLLSFGTFLSRTRAYAAVPGTFAQHPSALLKGFDELEMMAEVNRNTDVAFLYSHMHNAYLQTLMLTGVPGLLMALWLSWRIISSAFRVLFARDSGIAPTQKLLISLPAALFLQAMLEHYLFVDNYSILNFLFFLFSGYLVQLARGVTWKLVFPFLARRKKA